MAQVAMAQVAMAQVWINEFHYDDAGGDNGEFVEVAGAAGTDLAGFTLVLYNGNNQQTYNTVNLVGAIPDEGAGFGAIAFPIAGIQNGAPDGIALVDLSTNVLEFWSYEGTFTASNGPAVGVMSTDVGVQEAGEPEGNSLQRDNANPGVPGGWSGPTAESPGTLNVAPCMVENIHVLNISTCASNNTYDLTVQVSYTNEPTNGTLDVLGQSFSITSSPQTVTVTNLQGDGQSVDVTAAFSADANCTLTIFDLYTAPACGCSVAIDSVVVGACDPTSMLTEMVVAFSWSNTTSTCWSVQLDSPDGATNFFQVQFPTGTTSAVVTGAFAGPVVGGIGAAAVSGCFETNCAASSNFFVAPCPPPPVWINEINYDDPGTDSNEFIEVAGIAGTDLNGFQIVLYNGNGGGQYRQFPLGGLLPDEGNGFGAFALPPQPPNTIQNGPDGIALVDPFGNVVEFLSYEGTFTATDGPAMGLTSVDIGLAQPPPGAFLTLQRDNTNPASIVPAVGAPGDWFGPSPQSPGLLNVRCAITNIALVAVSPCSGSVYDVQIEVMYENAPTNGDLMVNGQIFPVAGSPQVVTLTNLPGDGMPVDVDTSFSADPLCTNTVVGLYTAPVCVCSLAITSLTVVCAGPDNLLVVGWEGTAPDTNLQVVIREAVAGAPDAPFTVTNNPMEILITGGPFPATFLEVHVEAPLVGCSSPTNTVLAPACPCLITNLTAGNIGPCSNGMYQAEVIVSFTNAPATGMLDVNGALFPIGASPQTVLLPPLPGDGQPVDVLAQFTDDPVCTNFTPALFTAPNCGVNCMITQLTLQPVSPCDIDTSRYEWSLQVGFSDAPTNGMLSLNGTLFPLGPSPVILTMSNQPADGLPVDATVFFTADPACSNTVTNLFIAPDCLPTNPFFTVRDPADACNPTNGQIITYSVFVTNTSMATFDDLRGMASQCPGTELTFRPDPAANDGDALFEPGEVLTSVCAVAFNSPANLTNITTVTGFVGAVGVFTGMDVFVVSTNPADCVDGCVIAVTSLTAVCNGTNAMITVGFEAMNTTSNLFLDFETPEFMTRTVIDASGDPHSFFLVGPITGQTLRVVLSDTNDPSCTATNTTALPTACAPPPPCAILSLTNGTIGPCDPSGFYDVDIIVTHTNPPATGMLDVNGVQVTISNSPQTVTLTGLAGDGMPVSVRAAFTDLPPCTNLAMGLFTAPDCRPCQIAVTSAVAACVSGEVVVTVGFTATNTSTNLSGAVIFVGGGFTNFTVAATSGVATVVVGPSTGVSATVDLADPNDLNCFDRFSLLLPACPTGCALALVCPTNVTVDCAAGTGTNVTGTATAMVACADTNTACDDVMVGYADRVEAVATCSTVVSRVWSARVACATHSPQVCTQTIVVLHALPALTCPTNLTVDASTGDVTVTLSDHVSLATSTCTSAATIMPASVSYGCADAGTQSLLVTVMDECGNRTSCVIAVTVVCTSPCPDLAARFTGMVVTNCETMRAELETEFLGDAPSNFTYEVHRDGSLWYSATVGDTGPVFIADSGTYTLSNVTHTSGCPVTVSGVVTVDFAQCTNCMVSIFCPPDTTVSCTSATTPDITGMATATLSCATDTLPTNAIRWVDSATTNGAEITITRNWQVSYSNQMRFCAQTIQVTSPPPVLVCLTGITVDVSGGPVTIDATSLVVSVSGVCATARVNATSFPFDCGAAGTQEVTVSAFDDNHSTVCTVEVVVVCTAVCDLVLVCPTNLTVPCNYTGSFGTVSAGVSCANGSPDPALVRSSTTVVETATNCAVQGFVYRHHNISTASANGVSTSCTQVVTFIAEPFDITCLVTTIDPDAGPVTFQPDDFLLGHTAHCAHPTLVMPDQPVTFGCLHAGTNEIPVMVMDECGQSAMCTATVIVQACTGDVCSNLFPRLGIDTAVVPCDADSNTAITLTSENAAVCANFPVGTVFSVFDSAMGVFNSHTVQATGFGGDCGLVPPLVINTNVGDRTHEMLIFVRERFGGLSTCRVQYTVQDIPFAVTCPSNRTIHCTDDRSPANTGMAVPSLSCTNQISSTLTWADTTNVSTDCAADGYLERIERVWTATHSNMAAVCTQTIWITAPPPTLSCVASTNVDPAGGTVMLDPASLVLSATGDCTTPVLVSPTSMLAFTCDDAGSTSVVLTVRDECGGTAVCTVDVVVAACDDPCSNLYARLGFEEYCAFGPAIRADETVVCTNFPVGTTFDFHDTNGQRRAVATLLGGAGGCRLSQPIVLPTNTAPDMLMYTVLIISADQSTTNTCVIDATITSCFTPGCTLSLVCPTQQFIECTDGMVSTAQTGSATATLTCSNGAAASAIDLSYSDVTNTADDCSNQLHWRYIERTWTATWSNQTLSCTQNIYFLKEIPTYTCVSNVVLDPSAGPVTFNPTNYVRTTNSGTCVAPLVIHLDPVVFTCDDAGTTQQFEIVYQNFCDSVLHTCIVTVVIAECPDCNLTLDCPSNTTVTCTNDTSPAATGMAMASLSCTNEVLASNAVTWADTTNVSTDCASDGYLRRIDRTWSATHSNLTRVCTQTIWVAATPPTLSCVGSTNVDPSGGTVVLDPASLVLSAFGDCTTPVLVSPTNMLSYTCDDAGTTSVVLTVEDECGGTAVCTVDVVVAACPTTAPPPSVAVDLDILDPSCFCAMGTGTFSIVVSNDGPVALTNVVVDDAAYPACATNLGTLAPGASVAYTCAVTLTGLVNTVIATGSADGMVASATDTVHYAFDTNAPTITACPADMALGCGDPLPGPDTNGVVVTDDCANPVTIMVTSNPMSSCHGSAVRYIYTAVDACGNTSAPCTQSITRAGAAGPTLDSPPTNLVLACGATLPGPESPVATDGCGATVDVVVTTNFLPVGCTGDAGVEYIYTATDSCGSNVVVTQRIVHTDSAPPVLTLASTGAVLNCGDVIPSAENASAVDACAGDVPVSVTASNLGANCSGQSGRQYIYRAQDPCGNVALATQRFTFAEPGPPSFDRMPTTGAVLECDAALPAAESVTATDGCGAALLVRVDTAQIGAGCSGRTGVRYTYSAVDGCGQRTAHTQEYTFVDTEVPVLTCGTNQTLAAPASCQVTVPAVAHGVVDCGPTTVTQSPAAGATHDANNPLAITVVATDGCGNAATCVVTYTFTCIATIGGVAWEDLNANMDPSDENLSQLGLTNIPVTVRNQGGGVVATLATDSNGQWSVEVPLGVYTVEYDTSAIPPRLPHITIQPEGPIDATQSDVLDVNLGASASPIAIALQAFSATLTADGALVEWASASEIGHLGAVVWRGTADGPTEALPGFVLGLGGGSSYAVTDPEPATHYWLEMVDTDLGSEMQGPAHTTVPADPAGGEVATVQAEDGVVEFVAEAGTDTYLVIGFDAPPTAVDSDTGFRLGAAALAPEGDHGLYLSVEPGTRVRVEASP